jgi:protein TonB
MHTGESLAGAAGAPLVTDRQLRLLGRALLVSLLLHGALLVMLPMLREAQPSKFVPPPLTARLARPKPPPEPPKVAPAPAQRAPLPRTAARPPRPAPAPAAPPAPILAVAPAKPAAEAAAVAPAAPPRAAPAPAAARVEPAPAAAAGPDPESVARFRLALMDLARRYKRYPRIAQDNNWEGRVELRITYAESGALRSMTVKKSAGRAVLDDEAQAMIRSAQAQATLPPALLGRAFTLEIPVEFSLKD